LFGRAKARKAQYIWRFIQKLGKAALEVVVRCHVVEQSPFGFKRREVSPPEKWFCVRQLEGGIVKFQGTFLQG
jgi:hypothetical protein